MRLRTYFLTAVYFLLAAPLLAGAQTLPYGMTGQVQTIIANALAARELGDSGQERSILEQGLRTVGPDAGEAFHLYDHLEQSYADLGNLLRAGEYSEKMLRLATSPPQKWNALNRLLSIKSNLHLTEEAAHYERQLDAEMKHLRSNRNWSERGLLWQAGTAKAKAIWTTNQGHFQDAAGFYQGCLTAAKQHLQKEPENKSGWFFYSDCSSGMLLTQIAMGQLSEAGVTADELRNALDKMALVVKRAAAITRVQSTLGHLAMEQGRFDDARKIFLDTLTKLQGDTESGSSLRLAKVLLQLAQLEMLQGRWDSAIEWHQKRESHLRAMQKERGNLGFFSSDYAYTLLRLGKADQALKIAEATVNHSGELYDQRSAVYWECRAYLGIILAASGQKEAAIKELRLAIPKYLELISGERSSAEAGLLRNARLNWLLDGYIALLSELALNNDASAMDEAFRMADLARGSTVQRALAASASRANIHDPALAQLARQEQDLQRELSSLSDAIGILVSRGRIQEQDKIVDDMRISLNRLREQRGKVQQEIERRFPDYSNLLNPRPVGIRTIQGLLKPSEAVVSIYLGSDRSLVWAIPAKGSPSFAVVLLTADQIRQQVASLRAALDPSTDGDQLPEYPFELSYGLYRDLLGPVAAAWQGASELIVIPHGVLGQLPLGVLTTKPFSAQRGKLDYAEMSAAPWLIKEVAISQLPSAVAMPALRAGQSRHADLSFVGFGDPVFMASAENQSVAKRGVEPRAIHRRNLGIERTRSIAEINLAPAINFALLPQLPDTALEIEEISSLLAANAEKDVFLRERASESLVKRMDLSRYRIVMFATHGLMQGEMPGLYQPALALSNPAITGEQEDGMLTMEEILGLKLVADWVVLSACNSAAAGGQTGESVSGLGRAFFYAGAKSLLVTNWSVETVSARMLTTETFRAQANKPGLPRAKALQQASLTLMNRSAGNDYSYAHPMFWAPYTLVGDGG